MLHLVENHCFLCQKVCSGATSNSWSAAIVIKLSATLQDFYMADLHKSCWKKCSGTDEIKKEYTYSQWNDIVGEKYNAEYICDEYEDGAKYWYKEGKLHRLDGPAIDDVDGKIWYKECKLHRLDGPACEYADGQTTFWIEDVRYEEKDYWEKLKCST